MLQHVSTLTGRAGGTLVFRGGFELDAGRARVPRAKSPFCRPIVAFFGWILRAPTMVRCEHPMEGGIGEPTFEQGGQISQLLEVHWAGIGGWALWGVQLGHLMRSTP